MSVWKCLRLYADAEGISRVDSNHTIGLSEAAFAPPAPTVLVARSANARALVFIELPVGWQGGWHRSPQEQWVICLGGEMGYQAGDGTSFTLKAGTYILTNDTYGRGHNSWNAGPEPVRLAVVQM